MGENKYYDNVFINCPFDKKYEPILRAVVFSVYHCGFTPRCALEASAATLRIERIYKIMGECRYGIHDLSRTELDSRHRLPRFNMPLELGIFLGARRFGLGQQKRKSFIILDRSEHRYKKYISDLSGYDLSYHSERAMNVVKILADWLPEKSGRRLPFRGDFVWKSFGEFEKDLPAMCRDLGLNKKALSYREYSELVSHWLRERALLLQAVQAEKQRGRKSKKAGRRRPNMPRY
jgi:hypothetical protein